MIFQVNLTPFLSPPQPPPLALISPSCNQYFLCVRISHGPYQNARWKCKCRNGTLRDTRGDNGGGGGERGRGGRGRRRRRHKSSLRQKVSLGWNTAAVFVCWHSFHKSDGDLQLRLSFPSTQGREGEKERRRRRRAARCKELHHYLCTTTCWPICSKDFRATLIMVLCWVIDSLPFRSRTRLHVWLDLGDYLA